MDYSLMHIESLRRIIRELEREVASLAARGRDTRRPSESLEAAYAELRTR